MEYSINNRIVLVLAVLASFTTTTFTYHYRDDPLMATLSVNLDNPLYVTDDRFLSLGMDSNLIRDRWETFDFNSTRLKTLAKGLTPAYMRLMGTDGDRMTFVLDGVRSKIESSHNVGGWPFPQNSFNMTSSDWDSINTWTADVGWRLLFGINAQMRRPKPDGSGTFFDASNALQLLDYSVQQGYASNLDFEFGNEPDLWPSNKGMVFVHPKELAQDFTNFKNILQEFFFPHFTNSLLIGPDVAGSGSNGWLQDFLNGCGSILNATTFHQYYGGRELSHLSNYTSAKLLDAYGHKVNDFISNVKSSKFSSLKIWNGETSSTYSPPGNEPNIWFTKRGFTPVPPEQLAAEFQIFRGLLNNFYGQQFHRSLLVGPDVTKVGINYMKRFLNAGSAGVINATTFHQYYGRGENFTHIKNYLDPSVLDEYRNLVQDIVTVVRQSKDPNVAIWQGETSSTVSPPGNGIDETYVAGFMLLDKLGLSAKLGLSLVVRQTYYGFWFALVDKKLEPRPNYWLSLMFKRLVGKEVLDAKVSVTGNSNEPAMLRAYAHCTSSRSNYAKGSVVVYIMNLFNNTVNLKFNNSLASGKVHQFLWTAPDGNLTSPSILLNGDTVKMISDSALPEFKPVIGDATAGVTMPAYSMTYYVFPDIKVKQCSKDIDINSL